jgi:hypothetical protein
MTEQEDIDNARKSSLAGTTFAILEMAHQAGVGSEVAVRLGEIAGLIYDVSVPASEAVQAYFDSREIGDFKPVANMPKR